jgi:PHD/YefM family antitoxin component YafN of YafNO toxin-antitoxin module
MRTMSATEFKAKCLAVIDEIRTTGDSVVVTRRGMPLVELVRYVDSAYAYSRHTLRGTARFVGNCLGPVVAPEIWNGMRGE